MTKPVPVTAEALVAENALHGFFTRTGGVSEGIYAGLNTGLGSNDEREKVLENRNRITKHFSVAPSALFAPYQIHSCDVLDVAGPWANGSVPKVDALVTHTPGTAIAIQTADCGPVLFLDAENRVAGAAHAGWKGATGGILENTISAMETLGAERENITAVLGPTISQANYEVGPEFVKRLLTLGADNAQWLLPSKNTDHAMFDLPGYIVNRLAKDGVKAGWTGQCTYADEKQFFSYRRTTHRKEPDYGRQMSVIMLT